MLELQWLKYKERDRERESAKSKELEEIVDTIKTGRARSKVKGATHDLTCREQTNKVCS